VAAIRRELLDVIMVVFKINLVPSCLVAGVTQSKKQTPWQFHHGDVMKGKTPREAREPAFQDFTLFIKAY